MSNAEEFIREHTRNCSNQTYYHNQHFTNGTVIGNGGIEVSYREWLTPYDALKAMGIAREDIIGKVRSILNKVAYKNDGLDVNGDYCEQPYVELDNEFRKLLKEG